MIGSFFVPVVFVPLSALLRMQMWRVKLPSPVAAQEASATIVGQVLNLTTAGLWPVSGSITSVAFDPLGRQVRRGCRPFSHPDGLHLQRKAHHIHTRSRTRARLPPPSPHPLAGAAFGLTLTSSLWFWR